ncbi:E3 ubiquitin-protein ligase RNF181-like [Condylostylus longicornis]|uniref:E3 ubiquitin-protein ligase RNF181-like n=1 Tax=Condylostylus longicornis TaxID=2530218 RepID=UPI00244DD9F0|nr:E3 ubiquitin-protein ligase RNF181-like [Condylostylus longicornis]
MSPDSPQPTPPDVREKLKPVQYSEVASRLEAAQAEPTREAPQQRDAPNDEGLLSDMASTLTGVPLPDMASLRRLQSGILGRQPSGQPLAQPSASVVGNQLQSPSTGVTCPICFCQFEPKDEVIQMPCDWRHVFHNECLGSWLDQSQACPVCRSNVVESLKKKEEAEAAPNLQVPTEQRRTRPEKSTDFV